jgi:putative exporter of polyketide antibiotics
VRRGAGPDRPAVPGRAAARAALAYALLTGLLVGVYAGLVLLATQVLRFSSSVSVAAATLAAAGLFYPLRARVQRQVDRRFNRARYDADAAVAAFSVRLKDAVETTAVQADLLRVVHNTLRPAHMSVWIQGPESGD